MKLFLLLASSLIFGNSYGQFTYEKFEQITRDFFPGTIITTDGEKIEGLMKVSCEVVKILVKTGEYKTDNYPARKIESCIIDSAEIVALDKISFYNYSLMGRSLPMKVYAVLLEKGRYSCYISQYTEFLTNANQRLLHRIYIIQNEAGEKLELPYGGYASERKMKKFKSKLMKFCAGSESLANELEVFKYDFQGLEKFIQNITN